MRLEDIDKKIGMPDVDKEWAKFEKEVFPYKSQWNRAAAIIAITFGLSIVAVASVLVLRKLELPKNVEGKKESSVVEESTILAAIEEEPVPEEFAENPFAPISESVEKVTEYAKNVSDELPKVEIKNPEQKELVELSIDLTSASGGEKSYSKSKETGSLKGVYSVSVCDADLVSPDSLQANAVAELLLCSELSGTIENPNYYFENPDAQKDAELDLLMMTQGWRRYDIECILNEETPEIKHSIETSQTISGRVEKTLNSSPKNMKLWLLSPATGGLRKYDLKENSHFLVENLDFADGTPFTLQASTQKENTSFVQIYVDEPTFPKVQPLSFVKKLATPKAGFVEQAINHRKVSDFLNLHYLKEVVVIGQKVLNPLKMMPDRMLGEGNYWLEHSGTASLLAQRVGLIVTGVGNNVHIGRYRANVGSLDYSYAISPPTIIIDDFIATEEDFLHMSPSNIKQIEYFKDNWELPTMYGLVGTRDLLIVYTKHKSSMLSRNSLSMKNVHPLGYSQPVEFYSPQYPAADKSIYTTPDYRTTLFWSPALQVSADGKATLKFYNSDTSKRYLVTVEGVSEDGKVISLTKKY